MKYAIFSAAALIAVYGLSNLLIYICRRRTGRPGNRAAGLLLAFLCGTMILAAGIGVWSQQYYRAGDVEASLSDSRTVDVEKIASGWMFDGPGSDTALVFYPGGMVEETAYAPLLSRLAEEGIDCFLLKMPLHLAFLKMNAAEAIMNEYPYETWLVGGHSLGGTAAASFAASHPQETDGLVLLAAYPAKQLPDMKLLSVYGSEDGCLEKEVYEDAKQYWPADGTEKVIPGGNHAGFGCYGPQRGDGQAAITDEQQQEATVDAILELIEP